MHGRPMMLVRGFHDTGCSQVRSCDKVNLHESPLQGIQVELEVEVVLWHLVIALSNVDNAPPSRRNIYDPSETRCKYGIFRTIRSMLVSQ